MAEVVREAVRELLEKRRGQAERPRLASTSLRGKYNSNLSYAV